MSVANRLIEREDVFFNLNSIRKARSMTLVIGVRCKDGVVMVGDKRVIEGTDVASQEKITILAPAIVVAGAGATGSLPATEPTGCLR